MKTNWDWKVRTQNDLFYSVFNVSIARHKKVNNAFREIFGKRRFGKIQQIIKEKNGLMGIFHIDPTNDLMLYALMLAVK